MGIPTDLAATFARFHDLDEETSKELMPVPGEHGLLYQLFNALYSKFDTSTGHDHDGSDSKSVAVVAITGWGTTAEIADTAGTEAAGSSTLVPHADHVHAIHSHAHTSSTTGGDFAWADFTGFGADVTAVAVATANGSVTTVARSDHAHKGPTVIKQNIFRAGTDWGTTGTKFSGIVPPQACTLTKVDVIAETWPAVTAADGVGSTIGSATLDTVKFGTGSMFASGMVIPGAMNPTSVRKTTDTGATYTDYTAAATDTSAATDVVLSALSTLVAGDWVVVGYSDVFNGIMVAMDATDKNDAASVLTAEYSVSAGNWSALPTITDGTDTAGDTLKKSGNITWNGIPEDWAKVTIDGVEAYHVRLSVSVDLDTPTNVNEVKVIRSPGRVVSFTTTTNNTLTTSNEVWVANDEADSAFADVNITFTWTP